MYANGDKVKKETQPLVMSACSPGRHMAPRIHLTYAPPTTCTTTATKQQQTRIQPHPTSNPLITPAPNNSCSYRYPYTTYTHNHTTPARLLTWKHVDPRHPSLPMAPLERLDALSLRIATSTLWRRKITVLGSSRCQLPQ